MGLHSSSGGAFNLAIQSGRLLTRPYFLMLKESNTRTGFLERGQIDRICAALEATETADDGRRMSGELANVVRFADATGWRTASEVLPARMAARRLGRSLRATGPRHDEERRGTVVPVRGRHREGAQGPARDTRGVEEGREGRAVRLPGDGERIRYFRAAWANRLQGSWLPERAPALDAPVLLDLDVHVIMDNYGTHKTAIIRRWFARHPRFHPPFTPTYASWLNVVERWFCGPRNETVATRRP